MLKVGIQAKFSETALKKEVTLNGDIFLASSKITPPYLLRGFRGLRTTAKDALLEKFWRISLYVTENAIAKIHVTKSWVK